MSKTKRFRQIEGAAYWQGHLDRCAEQGLSLAAYARANALPAWQLYQWKARLRRDSASTRSDTPLFQRIQVVQAPVGELTAWRIRFPNGVIVECGNLAGENLAALLRQVCVL